MARKPKTAPVLETERLRLRPFRAGDLEALHALYGNAGNLRYWGVDPSGSLDETRRMLRWHIAYHPSQYAPGQQGKGYMREARRAPLRHLIDKLKVHKVEAMIRPDNKPSAARVGGLGFRLEGGPIRDRWWVGGRWHSGMLCGLVAGEER